MNVFKAKIIIGVLAVAFLAGIAVYGTSISILDDAQYDKAGPYYFTKVKGLNPGGEVRYQITYKQTFLTIMKAIWKMI